jgi:RNA polymerase sigma-70 factor (ECF subfamily)
MPDSDASLIARIVANDDRTAFELLVRRYQSPLRNFLRRLTRNDLGRADDLAQEALFKVYTSIHRFKGTAQFSTWLYRIAYNTFLNDQRKHVSKSEFDEAYHSPMTNTTLATEDEKDVDAALQQLPDRQRAIFDLHYKKGMTHQEVASALEFPLGSVKSDLARGRETLKAILKDWEPG